ncbi:hypothetical protein ACVUSL_22840, partial [Escherichia coli]
DVFAGKKSAQIREILINESAWEEMTCLFAPSLAVTIYIGNYFLRVISVEWPPPNGEFLFFLAGNTLPLLKSF